MGATQQKKCNTGYRLFPEIYAVEIAKHFAENLQAGENLEYGLLHGYRGCLHWFVIAKIGENSYIPAMCFTSREEANEYCERLLAVFPSVCEVMFGAKVGRFSAN